MERATALSALDRRGSPPFHLFVNFKLGGMAHGGKVEGRYTWTSIPGEKWRREIKFGDYSQIETGGGGKRWLKRTLDFRPMPVTWINHLIEGFDTLAFYPGDEVSRVYSHGHCTELKHRVLGTRDLCFDSDGTLRSVQSVDDDTTYTYSDYEKFTDKVFPRTMRVTMGNRVVVDASVDELAVENAPSEGLFVAPTGAQEMPGCAHPMFGAPIKADNPSYPPEARVQHRSGTVTLYVLVASDGTPQRLQVIQTAGKDLDDAALLAVKQWKFAPFACEGAPVPMETEVAVHFKLSP